MDFISKAHKASSYNKDFKRSQLKIKNSQITFGIEPQKNNMNLYKKVGYQAHKLYKQNGTSEIYGAELSSLPTSKGHVIGQSIIMSNQSRVIHGKHVKHIRIIDT